MEDLMTFDDLVREQGEQQAMVLVETIEKVVLASARLRTQTMSPQQRMDNALKALTMLMDEVSQNGEAMAS